MSDDWVVRYENRFFQLESECRHYARHEGRCWCVRAGTGA
jgi:hypothetical protein